MPPRRKRSKHMRGWRNLSCTCRRRICSAQRRRARRIAPCSWGARGFTGRIRRSEATLARLQQTERANAARELGCQSVLIGHCEERADKLGVLAEAGVTGRQAADAVNRLLSLEVRCRAGGGAFGALLHRRKERGTGGLAGRAAEPAGNGGLPART